MGFKNIIVALDRSPQAPLVLEQAQDLAQKEGAKLLLFHAINVEVAGEVGPLLGTGVGLDLAAGKALQQIHQNNIEAEIAHVRDNLQAYCRQAKSQGLDVEFSYEVGDPGSLICDRAAKLPADLIVMGRRGRQGFTEFFLGSVSTYVIHHANCCVLVVQGSPSPIPETPLSQESSNRVS